MSKLRVLVTRPEPQAGEWVAQLRSTGADAYALPLIDIGPAPDGAAVDQAWRTLPDCHLVGFVSPNAAASFFAARPCDAPWPPGISAASPGPGTTRVLRSLGVNRIVEPAADAPQFDSETLWAQMQHDEWQGRRVLMVRGTSGRDWLADRLRERGAQVGFVAAYTRAAPRLLPARRQVLDDAMAAPARHVWLFSSSEAIDHLEALVPDAAWQRAIAIATHPRIAERARALGIARVLASRPGLGDVVACIESIAS